MQFYINGRYLNSNPPDPAESPEPSELPVETGPVDTPAVPESVDDEGPLVFMEDMTGLEFMAPQDLPEVEEYVIAPESTTEIEQPILWMT